MDRRPGPETPGAGQSGAATDETKGSTPGLHGLSAMTTNAIKKQGTLRESFLKSFSFLHIYTSLHISFICHLCLIFTMNRVCVCVFVCV